MKFADLIKNKKKMNLLLFMLFLLFLAISVTYIVILNKRVYLQTDIMSNYKESRYGGTGSRNDIVNLVDKDYLLYRHYFVVPSLLVSIERRILRSHEGEYISYYVNPNQIRSLNNRKVKRVLGIGVSIGKTNVKGIWYWFSLTSYALKYSAWFSFMAIIVLVVILFNYKIETNFDVTFYIMNLVFVAIWTFIF